MIDWKQYGPIYTVAPGIKSIDNLPIIEFDDQENRYLDLKKKVKDNIFFDSLFSSDHDNAICNKVRGILQKEYPKKDISFKNFEDLGYRLQEDLAIFHRSNKLIALHVSFPSVWIPKEKIGLNFASIHAPVPGMEVFLKNEKKYVEMMVNAPSPIIRYVWGEHYGYFLCDQEPLESKIKVMHSERQTFIGLPEWDIGLFLIRKKVMLYNDTSADFQKWYQGQIQSMSEDQKKYKLK
jgi:hypothetical protein